MKLVYSITWSAGARSVSDMSRPSALADLRSITSSYVVGVCTGKSAGEFSGEVLFNPFAQPCRPLQKMPQIGRVAQAEAGPLAF
jgi:hypothetical protein